MRIPVPEKIKRKYIGRTRCLMGFSLLRRFDERCRTFADREKQEQVLEHHPYVPPVLWQLHFHLGIATMRPVKSAMSVHHRDRRVTGQNGVLKPIPCTTVEYVKAFQILLYRLKSHPLVAYSSQYHGSYLFFSQRNRHNSVYCRVLCGKKMSEERAGNQGHRSDHVPRGTARFQMFRPVPFGTTP